MSSEEKAYQRSLLLRRQRDKKQAERHLRATIKEDPTVVVEMAKTLAAAGDIPVTALGLSIRASNSLRRQGYHTVGDLAGAKDDFEIADVWSLGSTQFAEIRDALRAAVADLCSQDDEEGVGDG